MKKTLALILVLAAILSLTIPLIVAAESPPATPRASFVEMAEPEPVIDEATPVPTETDPGGAPIDLTDLYKALWSVLMLVITTYVVPWVRARIKAERLAVFDYWSDIAVTAAEKAYGAGHGPQKLKHAEEIMRKHGFTIDTDVVDALIKKLFEDGKEVA